MKNVHIPADYEIKQILSQAAQYYQQQLKFAFLNQIQKQIDHKKQLRKTKLFYFANLK